MLIFMSYLWVIEKKWAIFDNIHWTFNTNCVWIIRWAGSSVTDGRFLRGWSLSWVTTRFENCFLINFFYLTLCTFSFEIKESSLSNTRCLIQDVLSPHCGDKRMARRCTRRFLPNYFDMTSYHWNVRQNTVTGIGERTEKITWRHAQNVVSLRVLYIF
jgi:hypothetical protein